MIRALWSGDPPAELFSGVGESASFMADILLVVRSTKSQLPFLARSALLLDHAAAAHFRLTDDEQVTYLNSVVMPDDDSSDASSNTGEPEQD